MRHVRLTGIGYALAAVIAACVPGSIAMADGMPHMDMSHSGMGQMHGAPQTCGDLTLACAATATPFFAPDGALWIAARVGDKIFVTSSKDRGQTFSPSVLIDTGAVTLDWGPDARPKIVMDRAGIITVAYAIFRDKAFNGEVFFTRSTDGGRTFAPVKPITDVQESQRFVAMALDTDGHLFAAWLDKRDRVPAKAAGKDYPGAGLAFAWSNDQGASFSKTKIVVDNTCECCRLAVAFKGPGQPVVLFRDIFPGGIRDHAVITFEGPEKPGPIRRVSVDDWQVNACPHHGPSLAIAPDGSYHAAWFTLGKARQGLFYARSSDAGVHFSEPLPLGPPDQALSRPFVLATGSTIRLAWKAFDGKQTNIMVMASRDGGMTFGPARVAASTLKSSDHPILIEEEGRAFLSWQTQDGYRLIPLDGAS